MWSWLVILFSVNVIFLMKLVQYDKYLVSAADTDGLVFCTTLHQGINGHITNYASMCFQLLMDQIGRKAYHDFTYSMMLACKIYTIIWSQSDWFFWVSLTRISLASLGLNSIQCSNPQINEATLGDMCLTQVTWETWKNLTCTLPLHS